MKIKNLILSGILLSSTGCINNGDFSNDDDGTKDYNIIQIIENESVIVRKHLLTQEEMDRHGIVDSFAFELQPQKYAGISESVIPCSRIPDEYRIEGINVTISGNITDRLAGHSEPNARFRPDNIIELKSINYLSILTDLPWLKEIVDGLEADSAAGYPQHAKIYQCTYKDGIGFLLELCVGCPDYGYDFRNRKGESLCIMWGLAGDLCAEFNIDFENKTLIYEIQNAPTILHTE
jgi:hypothetical protein